MQEILTKSQIQNLIACGKILATAMDEVTAAIKPGVSSKTLDKIAEEAIRRQGGKPTFLNYGEADNPFPATICLSINNEVVHGIPSQKKIIRNGDLVSIDVGAKFKGMCTDMAKTIIAGKSRSSADSKLVRVTEEAMFIGIDCATNGAFTGDIGESIQKFVEKQGFSVVKALVGHGIGSEPHQDPAVPNYGTRGMGDKLHTNEAIAIEPMVNVGTGDVRTGADGWTVKTLDGKRSAHFEHTILITEGKPAIITQSKRVDY